MFVKGITKETVVMETPAKVNLFLEVLNRRQDGYHNINSLFQAVSLFDRLEFRVVADADISIEPAGGQPVTQGSDNLIARAYDMMKSEYRLAQGFNVTLEKNIPVAAGLGGGSSDAAATILACSLAFNLGLDYHRMARLGLEIGSDVPFFFTRGQALVAGRGDTIKETTFPTDYILVLVTPRIAVSTADSYAALKRGLTISRIPFNLGACRTVEELVSSLVSSGNDFEEAHLKSNPELGEIKGGLMRNGAILARMSGSGPTVFGMFDRKPGIKDDSAFNRRDWQINTVRPITLPGQDTLCEGGSRGNNGNPGYLAR